MYKLIRHFMPKLGFTSTGAMKLICYLSALSQISNPANAILSSITLI